jgi:hypothetical protein
VPVSCCRVAEAAKLLENIFRSVNIALVNELKLIYASMGIDIWEVIEAAKTKPFGFMAFYPGPGLGGHCIPIDPFYLTWKARQFERSTRFIELAGEINTSMPVYVVERLGEAPKSAREPLNGSRVLVLGLAYKPNVDDEPESPSYRIMELLKQRGGRGGLLRSARAGDSAHARPPAMGGEKIRTLGPNDDRFIRRHGHSDRPCVRELSGTRRLGGLHCRHSERDGDRASCAGEVWKA